MRENELAAYTQAKVYWSAGDFAKVVALADAVLAKEQNPSLAETTDGNLLGLMKLRRDSLRESNHGPESVSAAQDYLQRMEKIHGQGSGPYLLALRDYGYTLRYAGRLSEALEILPTVPAAIEAVFGASHIETQLARHYYIDFLGQLGQYVQALPLAYSNYQLALSANPPGHFQIASSLDKYAFALRHTGRLGEALLAFERLRALQVARIGPDNPRTIDVEYGYVAVLRELGRLDEAYALVIKSIARQTKAVGAGNNRTLNLEGEAARIELQLGRNADALLRMQRVSALAAQSQGIDHPRTLVAEILYADALVACGRLNEALATLNSVLARSRAHNGEFHQTTTTALFAYARTAGMLGQEQTELNVMRDAVARIRQAQGPRFPALFPALRQLAEVEWQQGNYAQAEVAWQDFIEGVEVLRSVPSLDVNNRQSLFAAHQRGFKQYARFLVERGDLARAFEQVERSKARALLDETAARHAREYLPVTARNKLLALDAEVVSLNMKSLTEESDQARQRLSLQLDGVLEKQEAVQKELAAAYPRYAQTSTVALATAASAQSLPADTALLEYFKTDTGYLGFLVDRVHGVRVNPIGIDAHALESSVVAFREILQDPAGVAGLAATGRALWQLPDGSFKLGEVADASPGARQIKELAALQNWLGQQLLGPWQTELRRYPNWLISPDGALAALPFDALNLDQRPVLEGHDLSVIQSLSAYQLLQARQQTAQNQHYAKQLFAMGDAHYQSEPIPAPAYLIGFNPESTTALVRAAVRSGDAKATREGYAALRGVQWTNLAASSRELDAAAQAFGAERSDILRGDDATEEKLQQLNARGALADYRYLLFSTHGYLSTEVPALSAIVLGQTRVTPAADGYVTAAEWPGYHLNSELTILSACETGLGKQVQGEGVMGLPYALFVAGNLNTVMSLWKIDDAATAEFMRRFFRHLANDETPRQALNATKREFILHSDSAMRKPAWWAGFVLYGL